MSDTSAQPGRTPIVSFALDWVLFAALPLWALLGASALYRMDLVLSELQKGSLVVYGLCCFVAHYDELRLAEWRPSGRPGNAIRNGGEILRWIIITLSLLIFAGVIAGEILGHIGHAYETDPNVTKAIATFLDPINNAAVSLGWVIAAVGLVTGMLATLIATRTSES